MGLIRSYCTLMEDTTEQQKHADMTIMQTVTYNTHTIVSVSSDQHALYQAPVFEGPCLL